MKTLCGDIILPYIYHFILSVEFFIIKEKNELLSLLLFIKLLSFRTQHIHFNVLSFKCDLCSVFNECA